MLKAVCLTFDWVPKLIQISFLAMEKKIVQRGEAKVDADACKASYLNNIRGLARYWPHMVATRLHFLDI